MVIILIKWITTKISYEAMKAHVPYLIKSLVKRVRFQKCREIPGTGDVKD